MKTLISVASAILCVLAIAGAASPDVGEWGDAPEGAVAYPWPAVPVVGQFPTCYGVPLGSFIYHGQLCWSHFPGVLPPPFDFENEGNAGTCPLFSPYDSDECFGSDAGLMFPEAYTIDQTGAVVPCPGYTGTSLGYTCSSVSWGVDIDIQVTNAMPCTGYVNVLMDFDQSGYWGDTPLCPTGPVPEHVLINWPVPPGYTGPLSQLGPGSFMLGPNDMYVWTRFTVSESPVPVPWDGSGGFEDGETEDYLLEILSTTTTEPSAWGTIKSIYR